MIEEEKEIGQSQKSSDDDHRPSIVNQKGGNKAFKITPSQQAHQNNQNSIIRKNNRSKVSGNDYENGVSPENSSSFIPPLQVQNKEEILQRRITNISENSVVGSTSGSQVRGRHLVTQTSGPNSNGGQQFNNKSTHDLNVPYQDNHIVTTSNSHGGTSFNQHGFSMQKVPSKLGNMQLSQQ